MATTKPKPGLNANEWGKWNEENIFYLNDFYILTCTKWMQMNKTKNKKMINNKKSFHVYLLAFLVSACGGYC